MGIVIRQSVKNLMVTFMGAALGALIIGLSTKYIPKQELGFVGNLTNYAVAFSQIFIFGLSNVISLYVHKFSNNPEKRKLIITLCFILPFCLIALSSIAYFIFRSQIVHHFQQSDIMFVQRYYVLLPVFTAFFVYISMLEYFLGSQMKIALSAFMREVVLRIANIALILLFVLNLVGFDFLVYGTVIIYCIPLFSFFLISTKTPAFGISFNLQALSLSEYKEISKYAWYHFLLNATFSFMSYMDIILLPLYDHTGFVSVAIYRVAVFFIAFLQIPLRALVPASYTVLAKAFAEENYDKAKDIFNRSSINILIPTICIAIIICSNLQNAIAILPDGYEAIIPVFLILFIGTLANVITGMNDHVLSVANYYKFTFYLSIILIGILFILIRVLVPHYGLYGAAWSTTITLTIFNIAKYLFVLKKLHMQPFSSNTLLVLAAGAVALAAGYFFPYLFSKGHHIYVHTFIDVAIRSVVVISVYFVMLLWLKPSPDLEDYLASIKKNKRLF